MILPIHRFEEFGSLTASERAAIHRLGNDPYCVAKKRVIRPQGRAPKGFFLLVDGWVASARLLANGDRQITNIHLPGEALGLPSLGLTKTMEELSAITDATVVEVPSNRFGRLFVDQPRLAAVFMLSSQLEHIALMDRQLSTGRNPAKVAIASFLLDILERLQPLGLVADNSFDLPVTQEQIGDLLGLTSVHVNRMLKELTAAGLITRSHQRIRVLDRSKLSICARRVGRELTMKPAWLPPAS